VCPQAEEALSRAGEERSEAAGQYEAYIEQLQQHGHTLAAQAATLRDERDQYAAAAQHLQAQLTAFQQQGNQPLSCDWLLRGSTIIF
jgi:uncharacterized coiled-coil DUF342 family protein